VYLEECIQSVLNQESDFPVEIIVADDGSKDDSIVIAQSMSAVCQKKDTARKQPESSDENCFESTILVVKKPADCKTQGAAPTRNRGVAQAQYSYIAFLDSDDIFLPGHLKRLFHFLEQHSEFAAAIDQLYGFGHDINNRWIMPYPDADTVKLESFFLSPYFNPSVAMIRHTVLKELEGPFEESLRFAQDIDLFFRILEKHQIAILPEAGAVLREHDERSTGGKSPYMQYQYAEMAFNRAIARHSYPKKLARKRKAVIQYYVAKGDLLERKYFSAARRLLHAFFLDPIRAIQTVLRRKF
jgi:glycosyltransferase involved in cell wall biosynthesis